MPEAIMIPRRKFTPRRIRGLAAWWSAQRSPLATGIDGTGGRPADAAAVGWVGDLSGNGFNLTSSATGARPAWHANGFTLPRASIYSESTSHDMFCNTTLASTVFTGTNPSFTVSVLMARRSEVFGSSATCYMWGVQKNGGTIVGSSGNPFFGTRIDNSVYSSTRPLCVNAHGRDNDTSVQTGTVTYDDGDFALGYGGGIGVLTRVESGTTSKLYWNGHLVTSQAKTSGAYTFASGDYFTLGKTYNGTTRTGILFGHWYEAAIYNRALTDEERQKLEGDWLAKLGVDYVPITVTTPKKLWFIGHSMFLSSDPVSPDVTHQATPPYLIARGNLIPWEYRIGIANQSVGGQRLVNAGADNDQTDVLTYKVTRSATIKVDDIVIHRGPTNDVQDYDTNNGTMDTGLATEAGDLKAFIVAALAEASSGGLVHVTDPTIGTGSLTDSLTSNQRAVRRYGLSQWPAIAAAVIGRFDRAEISNSYPLLSDGSLVLPTAYNSGDGVHLSRAGYDIETAKLATTLNHLIACNPKSHANLIRWYSGRNQTSSLADAAAMASIADLSSTGDNAAQATAANKPTFRLGTSTSNYKATIRFDAAADPDADFVTFTAVSLPTWTLIIVVKTNADDARIIHDEASGNGYVRLTDTTTTRVRAGAGNVVRFTHAARSDYDVLVITSDARMWINGVAASVSDAEQTSFNANFVADQLGRAANPFAGELFDVAIYNAALPIADINTQANYFAYKAGKTWRNVVR